MTDSGEARAHATPNVIEINPRTHKQTIVTQGGSLLQPLAIPPGPDATIYKGLYDYRAGQFDAAVASCRACRKRVAARNGDVDALAATSLAIEAQTWALSPRLETPTAPRGVLVQAKKLIDGRLLPQYGGDFGELWHDRLAAQILYQEAETLLQSEKNGPNK